MVVLKDKEYAISKDYSTTEEDIFEVVKILKSLRNILFKHSSSKIKLNFNPWRWLKRLVTSRIEIEIEKCQNF